MAFDSGWEAPTGGHRRLVWLGVAAMVAVVAALVLAGGEGNEGLVVEDVDEPALPPAVAEPHPRGARGARRVGVGPRPVRAGDIPASVADARRAAPRADRARARLGAQ